MRIQMERRTKIFVIFMALFFGITLYFTYYSKALYLEQLPKVKTVEPKRTELFENGRYLYEVPITSLRKDEYGKTFLLTARYQKDIMGERYLATRIDVWKEKDVKTGWILVDGIVREESVIIESEREIQMGESIKIE